MIAHDDPQKAPLRRQPHYPALDGLRGLAILLVVLFHCYYANGATPGSALAYALVPFRTFNRGVDLFFVLSGFLIGGILADTRGTAGYYRSFYTRRAFRILPLYLATLGLFGLAVLARRGGMEGLDFATRGPLPAISYLTLTQNFWMIVEGLTINALAVSWSLAVEEHVYLFLPLLIAAVPPRWLPLVVTALVGLALGSRWFVSDSAAYLSTLSRLDAVGLGVLAALLVRHERWWSWFRDHPRVIHGAVGVFALGWLALTLRLVAASPFGYTLLALFFVSILLASLVDDRGLVARLFSVAWLRGLGTISYAVYLLHLGVLAAAHGLLLGRDDQYPAITDAASAGATLLALVTTLLLAAGSWRYFESGMLRLGRRLAARWTRDPASGAL